MKVDDVVFIHRPRKRDICVALAGLFWQMRPESLVTHGFGKCRTIAARKATEEDLACLSQSARVTWMKYTQWSNLVEDERKIAGDEFADHLQKIVCELIPEFVTAEIEFPEE